MDQVKIVQTANPEEFQNVKHNPNRWWPVVRAIFAVFVFGVYLYARITYGNDTKVIEPKIPPS